MLVLSREKKEKTIHPSELKDGQIAIITNWTRQECLDTIVQKSGPVRLIAIGKDIDFTWADVPQLPKCCTVRVLEEGAVLIVENNQ